MAESKKKPHEEEECAAVMSQGIVYWTHAVMTPIEALGLNEQHLRTDAAKRDPRSAVAMLHEDMHTGVEILRSRPGQVLVTYHELGQAFTRSKCTAVVPVLNKGMLRGRDEDDDAARFEILSKLTFMGVVEMPEDELGLMYTARWGGTADITNMSDHEITPGEPLAIDVTDAPRGPCTAGCLVPILVPLRVMQKRYDDAARVMMEAVVHAIDAHRLAVDAAVQGMDQAHGIDRQAASAAGGDAMALRLYTALAGVHTNTKNTLAGERDALDRTSRDLVDTVQRTRQAFEDALLLTDRTDVSTVNASRTAGAEFADASYAAGVAHRAARENREATDAADGEITTANTEAQGARTAARRSATVAAAATATANGAYQAIVDAQRTPLELEPAAKAKYPQLEAFAKSLSTVPSHGAGAAALLEWAQQTRSSLARVLGAPTVVAMAITGASPGKAFTISMRL